MQTTYSIRTLSILSALALGGCPSDEDNATGTASATGTDSDTEDSDSDTEDSNSNSNTIGSNSASVGDTTTAAETSETADTTNPTDPTGTTDPTDTDPTDTTTDTDPTDTDPTTSDSDSASSSSASDSDSASSSSTGAAESSSSVGMSASDSDSDTNNPLCEAPGELIACDDGTDDPFQAMGLGCEGDANSVIPINNAVFSSADPDAWHVATQLGTYVDPVSMLPLFSPREGASFLVISTGNLTAPDGNGVITMTDADVYDSNDNPDNDALPAPMTTNDGSNNGAGGTPFVNCDGVDDCSDTIETQWIFGGSDPNDMLWFQFETDVPGGTNGWSVDFAYFSVEFPEWVDTEFNDIFLVWSASETYTGNLCFVNDEPCTVTALWPVAFQEGAPELEDTGFQDFGGGTGWYTMQGSAAPGETLQLTTAVFDMGDTIYDTVVIMDNWRWDCEGCVPSEVMGCGIEPTP